MSTLAGTPWAVLNPQTQLVGTPGLAKLMHP
jgi:hypothetical protein